MDLSLTELKSYLRIDGSEDDTILALLVAAAKEYLANAGIPESDSAQYKLAVMLHCAMHYEHRDPLDRGPGARYGGADGKFTVAFESMILQLKAGGGTE